MTRSKSLDSVPAPTAARFLTKLAAKPGGCIEWTASRMTGGYGQFWLNARPIVAHRVAWAIANGPIPEGMVICHRCDNPPCCNPAHLFLGTVADNNADRTAKGRSYTATHCPKGHRYAGGNTYIYPSGAKECRPCRAANKRARRASERVGA